MSEKKYDVILTDIDQDKDTDIMLELQERENLEDSIDIIFNLPYILRTNISEKEALDVQCYYKSHGASLTVVESLNWEDQTNVDSVDKENDGNTSNIPEALTNQINSYYNLAITNLKAGRNDKAIEYLDKIHEIDANNYLAWRLKSKIEWVSYLKEYKDTTIAFSNDISVQIRLETIESRVINEAGVNEKTRKLHETNSKAFSYANMAYSCANENQKIDLLSMLTELAVSHIYLLFTASKELCERRKLLLAQQHNDYFKFVKGHYDDETAAEYLDKYTYTALESIEKIKNVGTLIESKCVLDSLKRNISNNPFTKTRDKIEKKITDIKKAESISKITLELEMLVKSIKDNIKLIEGGDKFFIRFLDEKLQKLRSTYNSDLEIPIELKKEIEEVLNYEVKKGCYVATCVYGSYDCPEVWTLRRFRDFKLAETWYGRLFIKTYYAVSPKLVNLFGDTKWFKKIWKNRLDKMVCKLKEQGYKDTKYSDKF